MEWGLFRYGERVYGKTGSETADEFDSLFGPELHAGQKVLDAGCGFGHASLEMKNRHSVNLFTSDISGPAVKSALDLRCRAFQADLMRLPVCDGSFDVAFAMGVLHYLPSPGQSVKELSRVVRAGGLVAFSIWPPFSRWFILGSVLVRSFCRLLPVGFVRALAYFLAPCYGFLHRVSGQRRRPVSIEEAPHIMFNLMTAPYLQSADEQLVESWLKEAGCAVIRFDSPRVRVIARKNGA